MTTTTNQKISITADGVWAGDGRLVDGSIEDCPAILGGSQDAAEDIYEQIEEAIAAGDDEITVDGVRYSWTIEPQWVKIGEFGLPPTAGWIMCPPDCREAVQAAYDAIEEGDLGSDVLDDVRAAGGEYVVD